MLRLLRGKNIGDSQCDIALFCFPVEQTTLIAFPACVDLFVRNLILRVLRVYAVEMRCALLVRLSI